MRHLKFTTLTALALITASCAKPGSGPSDSPIKKDAPGSIHTARQVGEGSSTCPFSIDPASYEIKVPESTKLLAAIPTGRYVLTEIRAHRSTLTTLETAVFSNGLKIILKDPGQLGTSETTHVLLKDVETPLTSGNLSFPLTFESKKGVIAWGRFASYEPKIETGTRLSIAAATIKDHDEKILNENTGRYTFNVFARKQKSGYSTVVKLSGSDFGVIKGLVAIESETVRFVLSMPPGSSSTDIVETSYELTFKVDSKAKAPDCGANASAIKVLGSSS